MGVVLRKEVKHEETTEKSSWRASVEEGDTEIYCSKGCTRICVKSSCLSYFKRLFHDTTLLLVFYMDITHSYEIHYLVSWMASEDAFFWCIFSFGLGGEKGYESVGA